MQLILKGIVPYCELVFLPLEYDVNIDDEEKKQISLKKDVILLATSKIWSATLCLKLGWPKAVLWLVPANVTWFEFKFSLVLIPCQYDLAAQRLFIHEPSKTELPWVWQDFDEYSFDTGRLARSLAFVAPQWGAMCAPASM